MRFLKRILGGHGGGHGGGHHGNHGGGQHGGHGAEGLAEGEGRGQRHQHQPRGARSGHAAILRERARGLTVWGFPAVHCP